MLRGGEESRRLRAALTSSLPPPTFPKSEQSRPGEHHRESTEGRRKAHPRVAEEAQLEDEAGRGSTCSPQSPGYGK